MPLGNPIRKQNESRVVSVLATEGQTVFTVQGGYIINQISVFRNGVRLSNSEDFTAGDGSTVTLNNAANVDDRIEFHIFDRFTVQNAIVSAASTQTISGDVVVNGKIFGNLDVPSINTGIVTATNLNVTGVSTFQNNVHLLDSDRLQIGGSAGTVDGIELYHDGSGSYIDNSTGSFFVRGDTIKLRGKSVDEDFIEAFANGSVRIYYNNSIHLETTPSGVDVTGTLNVSGISTFGGTANFAAISGTTGSFTGNLTITNTAPQISLVDSDNNSDFSIYGAAGSFNIYDETNSASRLLIASDGTVTVVQGLELSSTLTIPDSIIHSGDTDTKIRFPGNDIVTVELAGTEYLRVDTTALRITDKLAHTGDPDTMIRFPAADTVTVETGGSERIRIDSAGKFGIGQSPNTKVNALLSVFAATGDDDASDWGANGIFQLDHTGTAAVNNEVLLLGAVSGGVGQIASGFGFGRESTSNWGTYISFKTHSTGTSNIDELKERVKITSSGDILLNKDNNQNTIMSNTSDGSDNSSVFVGGGGGASDQRGAYIWAKGNEYSGTGGFLQLNAGNVGTAPMTFSTAGAERLRIDSSGRLLIGTTSHTGHALSGSNNSKIQLESASSADYGRMSLVYNGNDAVGPGFWFGKSRGTSIGSNTVVQNGDQLGGFFFHAADGTDKNSRGASIVAYIDGNPGANDVPTKLEFSTTADNASATTARMTIDPTGNTHFGAGSLNSSNTVSIVPSDGLINFGMDGRTSFVTGQNSCYIYSGEGSSGTTLAGDLILQSRSNQNRKILFVVGDGNASPTPVQKARIDQYGLYVTGTVTGKAVSASSAKAGSFDPYVFDVNGAQQSTETVSIKSQKNDCLDLTRYYTAGTIQTFRFNNDFTGRIETGTTSVTYHTSSDYRLKENAVAISDGITRLKQLKPYKFNFIKEPSVIHDGFFAHEVTPVVPTAVSGEKDATETRYYETGDVLPEGKEIGDVKEENAVLPQSLDYAKITPLLTAALQEAIAKIETLEAKVAALEGS